MSNSTRNPNELNFTFSVIENPNLVPYLKNFTVKIASPSELKQLFKDYTYSTIISKGSRKATNFEYAQVCIIDFDNKEGHDIWTIERAIAEFERLRLSYALITSKSHTPEQHRFHVFIPFNRPIKNLPQYKTVMEYVTHEMFLGSDPAVTDGARQIYHSPRNAIYHDKFALNPLDVDDILQNKLIDEDFMRYTSQSGVEQAFDAWDAGTMVTLEDGSEVPGDSVTELTYCFRKWHDVSDTPSAKIGYSVKSNNHFIHCFKCQKTFWKTIDVETTLQNLSNFYSYGKTVYEARISNNTC